MGLEEKTEFLVAVYTRRTVPVNARAMAVAGYVLAHGVEAALDNEELQMIGSEWEDVIQTETLG